MTIANEKYAYPKFIKVQRGQKRIPLIIHGQGVFVFESNNSTLLTMFMLLDSKKKAGLTVTFRADGVRVNTYPELKPLVDSTNTRGLSKIPGAYYWFNIDAQNCRLAAGIGETRIETSVYHYQFEITEENKSFLEGITAILIPEIYSPIEALRILRDPIMKSLPMVVKNTNFITMKDLARMSYLPKSYLSQGLQKLHDCVAGNQFKLNDFEFPNFSKAIDYSINTPGCWCYERLKAKSDQFGGGIQETYLRITLGENNGESPGIPHIMEIWPSGHYSPVHNHGGANAIIRVLRGEIDVSLYPFLSNEVDRFGHILFKKGDVTWISPSLNQVHKLQNYGKKACITIQCYMYDKSDMTHYDYFDYIDGKGMEQQFEPDSDMGFLQFKAMIHSEWKLRPRCLPFFYTVTV